MTQLSVNINKIALLRNSRGRNYPDVCAFAERFLALGADGITLHPRPDQRHARYTDVVELQAMTAAHGKELNVEGYPTAEFLEVVRRVRPAQCTLVPDSPGQMFVDVNNPSLPLARELGAGRVELYTERYAETFGTEQSAQVLEQFRVSAAIARQAGLGVNAGHDLNLENLADFLTIPSILEVSIGHALIVECLELGMPAVLARYVALVAGR